MSISEIQDLLKRNDFVWVSGEYQGLNKKTLIVKCKRGHINTIAPGNIKKRENELGTGCRDCKYENATKYHTEEELLQARKIGTRKNKEKLAEKVNRFKSLPCVDCGHTYEHYAMEFDHLADKTLAISAMVIKLNKK